MILVDPDRSRAESAARRHGVSRTAGDYRSILGEIDGAIIAAPHHLHVPITLDCIEAGVHVLCEKPLAETRAEVDSVIGAVERVGVTVGVNNKRRLFASSRTMKRLIDEGAIGTPTTLEYYQGAKFDWPAATGSYFGVNNHRRKGVLLDLGAHVLDLVCWWLDGKPDVVAYQDDARGGTEAVARLVFEKGSCRGLVHLSWLSRLSNTYRISGDEGAIEGELYDERSVTLVARDGTRTSVKEDGKSDVAQMMVDSFLSAVRGQRPPAVSARDVAPSISLIEECYEARACLEAPWYADASSRNGV